MTDSECQGGNVTECQTPQVLRQAAYESRMADRLHQNAVMELDIQREAAMPGRVVNGYIQHLSVYPFTVTFFCEAQLKHYVDYCTEDTSSTVHFDATGCVIQAVSGQKRPLYYCLLAHDSKLPILEFITTCHKSVYIRGQLDCFLSSVSQFTSGKQVKPQYVVTDCSYAVMDACIRSFNGVSMPSYPRHCCRILTGHVDVKEIRSTTILCLCVAHTVKNVCNKVAKAEANIAKRKAIVCFFVCLQKADSLRKALGVYKLLHTFMTTEVNSKLVDEAEFKLRQMCCETGLYENIYDDDSVAGHGPGVG
jgi:hypothetical protein